MFLTGFFCSFLSFFVSFSYQSYVNTILKKNELTLLQIRKRMIQSAMGPGGQGQRSYDAKVRLKAWRRHHSQPPGSSSLSNLHP